MARLPTRFDLWVAKPGNADPARQADYILGALAALKEWHFLNLGAKDSPQAAKTAIEDETYLLVFSDLDRIEQALGERHATPQSGALPVISVATAAALAWCVECRTGLFQSARGRRHDSL